MPPSAGVQLAPHQAARGPPPCRDAGADAGGHPAGGSPARGIWTDALYRLRMLAGTLHVSIVQHTAIALSRTTLLRKPEARLRVRVNRSMLCAAQHPYVPVGDDSVWRYQGAAGDELARLQASAYGLVPDPDGKSVLNGACSWARPAASRRLLFERCLAATLVSK